MTKSVNRTLTGLRKVEMDTNTGSWKRWNTRSFLAAFVAVTAAIAAVVTLVAGFLFRHAELVNIACPLTTVASIGYVLHRYAGWREEHLDVSDDWRGIQGLAFKAGLGFTTATTLGVLTITNCVNAGNPVISAILGFGTGIAVSHTITYFRAFEAEGIRVFQEHLRYVRPIREPRPDPLQ